MNLTAITEPADIATLHFLDCAVLLMLEDFADKQVADMEPAPDSPACPCAFWNPLST